MASLSAGDNYECVDEVPPDEDTTTVSSDVDATDLYEMDDLSVDVIAVNAVSWTARAKLSAAS